MSPRFKQLRAFMGGAGGSPPSAFSLTSATPFVEENTVTWPAAAGATSYTLKRGTATGIYGTTVSTNATSPYVDTGLTSGTNYFYRVDAVNSYGSRTSTNEVTGRPPIYSSLQFISASSQYISAPTNAALNPNFNTSFWFSLWIKTTQIGQPTILANLNAAGTRGMYVLLDSGKFRIGLYTAAGTAAEVKTATVTVNDGSWHHVAVSYSGNGLASGFTISVDGASVSLTTIRDNLGGGTTTTTADVSIGCDLVGSPEDFFNGYINQFAFKMNSTLSAGNVTSIYNSGIPTDISALSPGVWLHLFGASDTIAANGLIDRGSAGMNFSPTNMTSANVINNIRLALETVVSFNGTDAQFNGGVQTALNFTKSQKLIFAVWVKIAAADLAKASFFVRQNPEDPFNGWDILNQASGCFSLGYVGAWPSDVLITQTASAVPTDVWVLLVAYTDGSGTAAGTHYWMVQAGTTSVSEAGKATVTDALVTDITNTGVSYYMGNVFLNEGGGVNDYFKGKMSQSVIILGQTCTTSFVTSYFINKGYARNMRLAPGAVNQWPYNAIPVLDQVGSVDFTAEGTPTTTTKGPLWFD